MTTAYSLAFDIGAYVGTRTDLFLESGYQQVIAVEAIGKYAYRLQEKYKDNSRVIVLHKAAGPKNGQGIIKEHRRYWEDGSQMDSALSSMSPEWVASVKEHPEWGLSAEQWNRAEFVEVVTLDTLIATYGEPDFIKIDVEGYEQEVIKGLTHPVKALSYEFHTDLHLDWSEQVADHLLTLANYEFNYDLRDSMQLVSEQWMSKTQLFDVLRGKGEYGDIYARRK